MQIMCVTGKLDRPAADVWPIVSDFGGLGRWNPAVISCTTEGHGVGCVRTFVTKAGTVKERIEALDDAAMRIEYSIISGSSIKVRNGRLVIRVEPIDGTQSRLTWTLDGEPDGVTSEELSDMTTQRYTRRIDDLRACLAQSASGRA